MYCCSISHAVPWFILTEDSHTLYLPLEFSGLRAAGTSNVLVSHSDVYVCSPHRHRMTPERLNCGFTRLVTSDNRLSEKGNTHQMLEMILNPKNYEPALSTAPS